MNARFWVWWNDSWVKLTIPPGGVVQLHESHETDEGYSFQDEIYEHDGDQLLRQATSGGSDCDGPLTHHSVHSVHLSALRATTEPQSPPWQRIHAWKRDAYAEAMGY